MILAKRSCSKETVSRLKAENQQLKKDLQGVNNLFQNAPAGIVLVWHGRILEANDTFLGYIGYNADEIINRNFLNFIHHDDISGIRFIHNRWNAGKINKGHYDTRLITEYDETILCSIEARRIRYKGRASYILNVTRLEDREAIHKKENYETRNNTELKMIMGFTSLLKKRSEAIVDLLKACEHQGELHSKDIDHVIERLKVDRKNILNDLSMLETILSEKDTYKVKKVIGINQIIDEAVNRVGKSVETGEIDIKKFLRAPSSLNGNLRDLTDAFTQLLLNSFSNVSGTGEIHITTEENAEKIYVYIQDSGLSVRENKIENIFTPFSDENSSLVHEVGMRFAKAVIERHGGEIEYLTGGGQGNIFQIILPSFKEPPKRRKVDRNKLKKAKILIVQPDDIAKELLAHLLSEKGCAVDKTGNTIEGLTVIKKKKINLLVADVEGLGVNNQAFWQKCRRVNPGLITVGLKYDPKKNENELSDETGPKHIILKPFDIKDAVNRISEIFMVEY